MEELFNCNPDLFSDAAKGHSLEEFFRILLEQPNAQIIKFLKKEDKELLFQIARQY